MRLFELMIGACSLFFVVFTLEPWAEIVYPHQNPFSVPAVQHRRGAWYILCSAHQAKSLMLPSLLPYCNGFHSISIWSSLQFSVTTFPFPLDAHVHHFSLLARMVPHHWVHLWCLFLAAVCQTLSVAFPLAHDRGSLSVSMSLYLFILHFLFSTSLWGYCVLDP